MNKNTFLFGLLLGAVIPFVTYAVLLAIFDTLDSAGAVSDIGLSKNFRARTSAIVAICGNAIAMNMMNKRRMTDAMRGLVIPTFVYVVLWVVWYGQSVF
ncbi:MAG: hypothetical protein AB8G22_15975 [Saprospiraceae bacterium]